MKSFRRIFNGWLALLAAAAAFPDSVALATHFRFGNLSWAPTPNPGEVEFRLIVALRRNETNYGSFPVGIDQYAELGDIITEGLGHAEFDFGDGTHTPELRLVVTAFSVTENWLIAEALHPDTDVRGIRHTYNGSGPYMAGVTECCRILPEFLNNRANDPYELRARVQPFSGNRSPLASLVPIITVPLGTNISFRVPAIDPDGDTLRFRLATDAEAGSCCAPTNLTVDATSGVVTWDTMALDTERFWTAQIIIEDLDSSGAVKSSVPLDFLLKILSTGNLPPVCNITPSGPFTVTAGTPISFTVSGTDPDDIDQLILNSGGLPSGATMTPPLPSDGPATGVSSTFNWTPNGDQGGAYPVLFTVTDLAGSQARCDTSITVRPIADLAVSMAANGQSFRIGDTVTYFINITNLGPSTASGVLIEDTLPSGVNPITATASQGHCTLLGSRVSGTLGALATGSNAVLTITGRAVVTGVFPNTVSVSSSSIDPILSNNTATVTVSVTNGCSLDLDATQLTNQTRCLCDQVEFSTTVASSEPVSFVWRANGVVLPGEIDRTLVLRNLNPTHAGLYTVQISTPCASIIRSANLTLLGAGNQNPVSFTNAAPITISESGPASLYPSTIQVDCIFGPIKHLAVTLDDLNHTFPDDLDILLVSPAGEALKLMSDTGGSRANGLNNVRLTFADTATLPLPDSGLIASGTYRPTDYGTTDAFPFAAFTTATATNFSPFLNTDPNGLWSLYVIDDLGGDAGFLARGWNLSVEWADTAPALSAPRMLPDGRFRATLQGMPRMTHVVETSTDLVTWIPISTNTLSGPVVITFEPRPGHEPCRFYRAVRCP